MSKIETALLNLGGLDILASQDTPIHRLDARIKVLTALAFIVAVVSFGKYEVSALVPLFLYPVALASIANLPSRPLLNRILLASPFAILVGAFNPLFDREIMARVGPLDLSGGWISFASILLRFALCLSAALILVATTGFDSVCSALNRLRVPHALTVPLMFLHRYIFVMAEEAARMRRACLLRSAGATSVPWRVFAPLAGHLLLRSMDRAQRIHTAMVCRGFDGEIRPLRTTRMRQADLAFLLGWVAFFIAVRAWNLPRLLGEIVMKGAG